MNPQYGIMDGCQLLVPDVYITLDSMDADEIDIAMIGYKQGKWTSLINQYVDLDQLKSFYKGLETVTGNTYSFDFKTKEKGNGGCIKSIIVTRCGRKKNKWSKAHIIWRTCQFETKFAGDLIMISRILNEAPNCDIKGISFYIPQGYMSAMYMSYLAEYVFDISLDKCVTNNHKFYDRVHSYDKWKEPGHRLCLRASVAKFQIHYKNLAQGIMPKPITYKDCKLPFTKG
jgi:hypothetical protein